MAIRTIHSRYTFGDEVQFESPNAKGAGKVFAIYVSAAGCANCYLIEIEKGYYSDLEPVDPSEIVGDTRQGSRLHALTITSKYDFGDLVRFDSINGKGTGKVHEIMLDRCGEVSYVVDIDGGLQPGIMETEIQAKIDQDRESNP
jgi:hypothetical protein